ncbi:tuberin isoform X2 [Anthonomus grandis grandis]|uniref:tuberin isoform X2 n=1 Tax=Anthonomus grandis grandis TaxID=2921223 RepID=UPI00216681F7|nr:tuberin isoform X2 [Anthonomus grandis grandis]
MSSKEKDNKTLPARFKDFFNRKAHLTTHPGKGEFTLSQERIRDISRDSPLQTRLKTLKELSDKVQHDKLADNVVEILWSCTEDLFSTENTAETRHQAFYFMQCLVKGQSEKLKDKPMRAQFFRLIKHHDHPEDIAQKLDLLIALTSNGKVVLSFEEEIGRFLLNWLPEISRVGQIEKYLAMIDNVIHFNAAYLDEEIINGIIEHICLLCGPTSQSTTIIICLSIMSSIVAYCNMSPDALPKFIGALCRTVIDKKYCERSWQIMKTLLGTHMGHSTVYTMCRIMQEPTLRSHIDLLRGAVFFTRKGLWTNIFLPNLKCPPSSILPCLLQAVKCNHPFVAYEVSLALQQLVNHFGRELLDSSWMIILQIISHLLYIARTEHSHHKMVEFKSIVMTTMNSMENLIEMGHYNGDLKSYYKLVEECALDRPDESILKLLDYLSKNINPLQHLWMTNLYNLLYKYFKPEMKSCIRIKVIQILTDIFKLNREQYEEELIERIVIPHMTHVITENNILIRTSVIKMLLEMCSCCDSKRCLELLDILEKLLFRPFDTPHADSDYQDISCLVSGLTTLFVKKIHKLPSSHAVRICNMLVEFLEKHYETPGVFQGTRQIRYTIFDCFLKMRADPLYHLGYPEGNTLKFSPYLCVVYRASMHSPPPQSPAIAPQLTCSVTYISLRRAFKVIISCLKVEKDWEVLNLVLTGIAKGLQNKSLVLGKGNSELDLLVSMLCSMVSDKSLNLPESLSVKISKADFHSIVSLVLVNLASYHSYLDNMSQTKMIRCIMKCIQSAPKSSKPCISALTICTLEMKDAMVKTLPEVLLALTKMSPTNHVAVPVLEFLSTITQLPALFTNFVADEYIRVFAVALPFSNPFKFNHYIVSLAHHVIAVWFLKCRLTFRRDFVRFIINGLKTNLQPPFDQTRPSEESLYSKLDFASLNHDSSDRKRSSSLTEQGSRRRDDSAVAVRMDKGLMKRSQAANKLICNFYEELNETCIDLMARYAFSPCSALPKRLPGAEFLLDGGQSMTWLVGNKLVTVTTSGCSQKILKQGLCDKCWSMCNTKTDKRLLTAGSSSSTEPSRQNSNEKSNNSVGSPQEECANKLGEESVAGKLQEMFKTTEKKEDKYTCSCWCQGWAEIFIRRPTGDMSWVMRIQNDISHSHYFTDFPFNELSTLYMPSLYDEPQRPLLVRQDTFDDNHSNCEDEAVSGQGSPKQIPSRQNSQDSIEEENDEIVYEDGTKARNPVRRSNSSPEMSAGWKNPFHKLSSSSTSSEGDSTDDKKGKMYSKDMRVSCEAIPEEIAGSPPQSDSQQPLTTAPHPSLLSYHSFPGVSSEASQIAPKQFQTVPPSPALQSDSFTSRPTTLPTAFGSLQPVTGKPPQSPTQTSPRLARHVNKVFSGGQELQKSSSSSVVLDRNNHLIQAREAAKERKNSGNTERLAALDPHQPQRRDRLHTISVMSPANVKPRSEIFRHRSGVNPSFVFLQLYNDPQGVEKPLLLNSSDMVNRAVNILDKMSPYETHTVGVLYIREGQVNNEVEIMKNRFGSLRYVKFLQNLGTLVKISDVDPQVLGGLDRNGADGKFTYLWQDDIVRVNFHIATMMPNKENEPNCNNKKMHIGNDYVNIVYNESGEEFDMKTIKSQFNFASIIIQPLDHNINRVVVKIKDELKDLAAIGSEAKVVSDQNVAILARQLAIHANLASLVARSLKHNPNDPYASNWLERLRQIKKIRKRVLDELKNDQQSIYPSEEIKSRKPVEDFTEYS